MQKEKLGNQMDIGALSMIMSQSGVQESYGILYSIVLDE